MNKINGLSLDLQKNNIDKIRGIINKCGRH